MHPDCGRRVRLAHGGCVGPVCSAAQSRAIPGLFRRENGPVDRRDQQPPLPMKPGRPARYDYEYRRNGTANLFFFFMPLAGWRHGQVTEQRTKLDFAECMRYLVDELLPEAEKIVLASDNLNTHTPAALYEAFPPRKRRGFWTAWGSIIHPNMVVGSIWSRSKLACSGNNASTATSLIWIPCGRRSQHGEPSAISKRQQSIGSSRFRMRGSSSTGSILTYHNRCDEVIV